MSLHTTLRMELARAQGLLRNGDTPDAHQDTLDALRSAYNQVRPMTKLDNGQPLGELATPHETHFTKFQQRAITALRHVDNAMLSVEDLIAETTSGPEIYNDIAAEILDALEIL